VRCFWFVVVAFASGLVLACGDTAVVLTVDGDLAIPEEIGGFCLAVADENPAGGEFNRYYTLGEDADVAELPQTLTVEPGSADSAFASVRGYLDGIEVARDRARLDFADGEVAEASVMLAACAAGHAGAPSVVTTFEAPAGARAAASYGRGGTLLAVMGDDFAILLRAAPGTDTLVAETATLPALSPAPVGITAFDADGDCDDDLLVLPADAPPMLFARAPDGSFSEIEGALGGSGIGPRRAAAAADVDGDSDVDLVIGGGAALTLMRNDGSGRFQPDPAAIASGEASDVTDLALRDLDGDRHVDLLVGQGDAAAAPDRVLFNDSSGGGFFESAPAALPEVPLRTRAVTAGDITGDGYADLLVGALGSPLHLYVNRGDGRLEDRSFVHLPSDEAVDATSIAVADWDGDCLLDIAVGIAGGASSPLAWRGSDTGVMIDEDVSLPAGEQVLLVDLDDDGVRDLVIVGGEDGVVWGRR